MRGRREGGEGTGGGRRGEGAEGQQGEEGRRGREEGKRAEGKEEECWVWPHQPRTGLNRSRFSGNHSTLQGPKGGGGCACSQNSQGLSAREGPPGRLGVCFPLLASSSH